MPKIKAVNLPRGATIDRQLHNVALDLLPSEMAKDPLARWVTEFDGLNREFRLDEQSFGMFEEDRGGIQAFMFCQLSSSALQARLPFYFATLFHIGRMQQISQTVLESASSWEEGRVVEAWSSSLAERLNGQNRRERAVEILDRLSKASKQYHSRQLTIADQWWGRWRTEVGPLRRSVEAVNEAWQENHRRAERGAIAQAFLKLWATVNTPSALQMSMSAEDVRFKPVPLPTSASGSNIFGSGQAWVLPLLIMGMGDRRSGFDRVNPELRHLLRDWHRAERERLMEPRVRVTLDRLRAKYAQHNPFDEFRVGQRAATPALRELAKENKLPNGDQSPWLHGWEESLEEMPWGDHPLPKPSGEEGDLDSALRLADSVIKKQVVEERFLPTESWSNFVQRVFEDGWIEEVGTMAGAANRKVSEAATLWTLDELVDFIERVVKRLNDIGYSLRTPSRTRLQILLDKASRGESVDDEEAW